MASENQPPYVTYNAVLQKISAGGTWIDIDYDRTYNKDGTWVEVPIRGTEVRWTSGRSPVEAALSVMSGHIDHKILGSTGALALKGYRAILTPTEYGGSPNRDPVTVTVEQVYENMIRTQVEKHVEYRDKLPALKEALDKAREAHAQVARWAKLGPKWIQDYSNLAATVGLSAEAIAAAAKVPAKPRQPRKKRTA